MSWGLQSDGFFLKIEVSMRKVCYLLFTESAHWVDSVIESPCPSVVLCHWMRFFPRTLIGPEVTWSVPGLSLVLPTCPPASPPHHFFWIPSKNNIYRPPKKKKRKRKVSVVLSTSAERFIISRMRDFLKLNKKCIIWSQLTYMWCLYKFPAF